MSAHFVKKGEPPPGISSFTRIRLGWIGGDKVVLVKPGQTGHVFLAPLVKGGDIVTVKIPLEKGQYYLIENRQPIGFDRILPDSGILILKVNPDAVEGTGTVKVMNPNPGAYNFSRAAYRLDRENSRLFVDSESNVAVIPLWPGKEKLGVLVTTPEKSRTALKAVMMMQKMWQKYPAGAEKDKKQEIDNCVQAFKRYDFERCCQIAGRLLKEGAGRR